MYSTGALEQQNNSLSVDLLWDIPWGSRNYKKEISWSNTRQIDYVPNLTCKMRSILNLPNTNK